MKMTPLNITIISLIAIGVLSCIGALIYTKIIKPNTFGYSNKNMITQHNYKQIIKTLNSKSKIWTYENIYISINEQSKPMILERILITYQNVYVITNPIEKKVIDIKNNNGNFKLIYKNKLLDLPLDINLCLSNVNILKKQIKIKDNLIVIIPMTNQEFITREINGVHFVQEENLLDYINKIDNKPSEFDFENFIQFIEKNKIKQKQKRKIFFNKPK